MGFLCFLHSYFMLTVNVCFEVICHTYICVSSICKHMVMYRLSLIHI